MPVSGSDVENVPTTVPAGKFSATLDAERRMSVGALLAGGTGVTVADGVENAPVPTAFTAATRNS